MISAISASSSDISNGMLVFSKVCSLRPTESSPPRINRNSRVDAGLAPPCDDANWAHGTAIGVDDTCSCSAAPGSRRGQPGWFSCLVADRDEIDELLDGVDERCLDVFVRRDGFQDLCPEET